MSWLSVSLYGRDGIRSPACGGGLFVSWCDKSLVLLNVAKNKDTSIDFRKLSSDTTAAITREEIEPVATRQRVVHRLEIYRQIY